MQNRRQNAIAILGLLLSVTAASAQQTFREPGSPVTATPVAASAPTPVPALVPFSGLALAADGRPLAGEASITFSIFNEESGGEALWAETQSATFDATGRYQVHLGAANPNGLPASLFATGEARWLEIQIAGQPAHARVLMASVPYALKAADAATLGGLPASAFALAGSTNTIYPSVAAAAISPEALTSVSTAGGASGYLPVFNSATSIVDSVVIANSTGIGILDTPASGEALDVNGKSIFRNSPTINRNGNATTSAGVNSFPLVFEAETYNSSSKAYTYPEFSLQAEAAGNDSSTPTSALHFLFNSNLGYGAETGLYFNANGTIHFASSQTFDGVASSGVGITGASTSSTGVQGNSTSGDGVMGQTAGNGGQPESGVVGRYGPGVSEFGDVFAGVWGDSTGNDGVDGTSNTSVGVSGVSDTSIGVSGFSNSNTGVQGIAAGDTFQLNVAGVLGRYNIGNTSGFGGIAGVWGDANTSDGVFGSSDSQVGVVGFSASSNGVEGHSTGDGAGVKGSSGSGLAGLFDGDVSVTGTLTAGAKDFKIDHPSDPANKYLNHASVESSEMMNIYTGNVTTDELGLATVHLPDWFEAENGDFRYQLTVMGQFAQAIVKTKIAGKKFTIMTNASHVEVSWLVTAVRQDAYAKAHPLVVEEAKPAKERGYYLRPELYGQPKEKQTEWGRHPETMRRMTAVQNVPVTSPKRSLPPGTRPQTANASH